MTIATVTTVVTRFLKSSTPEVLALKGDWGIGKTYIWKQLVLKNKSNIKLENYCYISLFGISSISELRTAIFVKLSSTKRIGEKNDNKWESLKSFSKSLIKYVDLPYIKNISVGLEDLAPHLIKDAIICLDDFERMFGINHDELLGFISELKEEKGCKIVLIFNEAELINSQDYKKYREKVVDCDLLFSPTSEEAAELALPIDLVHRIIVKKYVISLGIKNIRILRKIVSIIGLIHNEIGNLNERVIEQAIMTLVLLTWCSYSSEEKKPTIEFVNEWNRAIWGVNEYEGKEVDQKRALWAKTLQDYGLLHIDEFDRAILKVIEQGYLEESGFLEEAKKLNDQLHNNELEQLFVNAWGLFHNTFMDNQAELIQVMTDSFRKAVHQIAPINLDGVVRLLRQLGKSEEANELINFYIKSRVNEDKIFNLAESSFSADITDSIIIELFNKRNFENSSSMSLIDAVKHIAENNGWSKGHIAVLKNASEDDFYNLFKLEHGNILGSIVRSCLNFEKMAEYKSIGIKVRSALVRIGKENPLNAIRVSRFGITI